MKKKDEINELLDSISYTLSDNPNVIAEGVGYMLIRTGDLTFPYEIIQPSGNELKFTDRECALDTFFDLTAAASAKEAA